MASRIITITGLLFLLGCASPKPVTDIEVTIGEQTFHLEIAKDLPARREGLMNREALGANDGMIFIFPDAQERSFWMKNCFIPIDLIFLDSRGTITAIHEMLVESMRGDQESEFVYEQRMPLYWSFGPARFAIEFNSGTIKKLHLEVNDRINLDLNTLRNMAR